MVLPPSSRYYSAATYQARTPTGATVTALVIPPRRQKPPPVGFHPRAVGDRLDLLATRYLNEPAGFWRICDANNAPVPNALEQRALIGIPGPPS